MELKGITIRLKSNGDLELIIFPETLKETLQQFTAPLVTISKKRKYISPVGGYTHFQPIIKCELEDHHITSQNTAKDS